jgi:hypothetical protein
MCNACVIIIFGQIYNKVALLLVNWENHRFDKSWENSLIMKTFGFQFLNAYIALFAIAFEERDYNKLALNLAAILILKQLALNLKDYFYPMFRIYLRKRNLDEKWAEIEKIKQRENKDFTKEEELHYVVESQTILQSNSQVLVKRYSEIFI